MCKQPAISGLRHAMKKIPRRKQFPAEMDAVVRWGRRQSPHHPNLGSNGGRPPMPLETMPRMHFRQNWSAPSDPMTPQTFYDNEAIRRCAGNGPGDDRIPPLRDSATQGPAGHDLPLTDILRAATGGREGGMGGRPKHWVGGRSWGSARKNALIGFSQGAIFLLFTTGKDLLTSFHGLRFIFGIALGKPDRCENGCC